MKHHFASAITAINSFTDTDSLTSFLRTLGDHLPVKLATIWKINRRSDTVSALARINYRPSPEQAYEFVHSYSNSFIGKVTKDLENTGDPYVRINNIQEHTYWDSHLSKDRARALNLRSLVVIPARNYVLSRTAPTPTALLNLYADDRSFAIDEPLAKTIANKLSTLLSQHTLVCQAGITDSVLRYYAGHLTNPSTLQLLQGLVPQVLRPPYIRVEGASIYIWDAFRNHFSLTHSMGLASRANITSVSECLSTGITGEAACQRRPIIVDDLQSEVSIQQALGREMPLDEAHRHLEATASPPRSLMAIPIYNPSQGTQTTGVIRLINKKNSLSNVTDAFDDEDVLLMEHFARLLLFQTESAQSEDARQAFALQLAHELEAPSFAIKSTVHRLRRYWDDSATLPDPMRRKYLTDISQQATVQLALARSISYGLRSEQTSRRDRYQPATTSLREVIEEAKGVVIPICRSEGIPFRNIKIMGSYPNMFIDREAFSQVFFNLFTNAIKYRTPGEDAQFVVQVSSERPDVVMLPRFVKRVPFVARLEDADKVAGVVIKVSDWGIGVAKAYAERIFNIGVREPGRERYSVRGAGIGLSVARKILYDFGCAVWLSSCRDPTTFSVFLPEWLSSNRYVHEDGWKHSPTRAESR